MLMMLGRLGLHVATAGQHAGRLMLMMLGLLGLLGTMQGS